jgi:hypothetical protein
MRARRPHGPKSTLVPSTFVAVVVVGAAFSARAAQEADPFSEAPPAVPQSNVAAPSQQAPASAPAGSSANFPTGLVERLPSSAYPEPVIRGLYGSSLWLDMQGYQWPNYQRIGVGISGYGWVDTMYKRTRIGDPGQSPYYNNLLGQARFALRATPTYTNGSWFVQAQAELIANLNQLEPQPTVVDTDDIWVRTGTWGKWDVTVGKFEAFPVYHLGMGLDLNTDERAGAYDATQNASSVPQPYLASYQYYRPQNASNLALHLYPGRFLRIELLGQWGNKGPVNTMGGRPAIIFDLGWFKARFAAEYQYKFAVDPGPNYLNEERNRGVAGSIQFVFAPWIEFGPNVGRAITDVFTAAAKGLDTGKSGDIWSYGGFVNIRPFGEMLVGAGANFASFTNLHYNTVTMENDKSTNSQYFLAVQYLVYHQLFVKVVTGYAKTHFDRAFTSQNSYDDDMFSIRLRLMYLY